MATGGVELDVSSVDADDAVSGNFGVPCDPCGKKMKTTPAVSFCKTHKEYLCDYCCDLHKHYVSGKNDIIFEIDKKMKDLQIDVKRMDRCSEHGSVFVKFCRGHNELCCEECCSSKHIGCSDIPTITQLAINVDDSYKKYQPDIRTSITDATNVIGRCDGRIKEISKHEQLKDILKEIDQYKQDFISRIDTARSQIEKEFNESLDTESNNCETMKSTAEGVKSSLEDVMSVIRHVRAGGTNVEKFILNIACKARRDEASRELSCLNMKEIQRVLQWDTQLLRFLNSDVPPVTMLELDLKQVISKHVQPIRVIHQCLLFFYLLSKYVCIK